MTKDQLSGTDIITHSDIAWDRADDVYKKDLGPYFSYEALARSGLGIVPMVKDFPPLLNDQNNQKDMISCLIVGYRPCPVTGVMDVSMLKSLRAYALHFFPKCLKYTSTGYDFRPLV